MNSFGGWGCRANFWVRSKHIYIVILIAVEPAFTRGSDSA